MKQFCGFLEDLIDEAGDIPASSIDMILSEAADFLEATGEKGVDWQDGPVTALNAGAAVTALIADRVCGIDSDGKIPVFHELMKDGSFAEIADCIEVGREIVITSPWSTVAVITIKIDAGIVNQIRGAIGLRPILSSVQ